MKKIFFTAMLSGMFGWVFNSDAFGQKNKDKEEAEVVESYELPIVMLRKKNKMGFAEKGTLRPITEIMYDENSGLYGFTEAFPYTVVSIRGRHGLIDIHGKAVTELKYAEIDIVNTGRGFVPVKAYGTGKKGLLDSLMREAVPLVYDDMEYYFKDRDLFAVQKGHLWGVYDLAQGQEILPCEYSDYRWLSSDCLALKQEDAGMGCLCVEDGKIKDVLPFEYDEIGETAGEGSLFPVKKDEKWGFSDSNSQAGQTDFRYDQINKMYGYDFYLVLENNLWGIAKADGSLLFEPQFMPQSEDMGIYFENGLAYVLIDGKAAIIDEEGNMVLKTKYKSLLTAEDGSIRAFDGEKLGIIDKNGRIIVPFEFDRIGEYEANWYGLTDFTLAMKGGKYGFLNANGQAFTGFRYEASGCQYDNSEVGWITSAQTYFGLMSVSPDGAKWGIIDTKGNVVLPFEYDTIECIMSEGTESKIHKNGKQYFYDWEKRKINY